MCLCFCFVLFFLPCATALSVCQFVYSNLVLCCSKARREEGRVETMTVLRLFVNGGYGHHDFFVLMFLYASTTSTLTPSRALFLLGANILAHHHTPSLFLHSYLWAYVIKCSYFEMHHLPKLLCLSVK